MQLSNSSLIKELELLSIALSNWNDRIVIGGGVALILYDLYLSKANAGALGTSDIDYLIPRNPQGHSNDRKISSLLTAHGYELKNKSLTHPSVQSFIKQVNDVEIEIEFLTDNKSREKEEIVQINKAGVNAQALSYIEMSLNETMSLTLNNGHKVTVVTPEAWVFHKGLTFPKRANHLKKVKDLYGIWFALTQLQQISIDIKINLPKLMAKNPKNWKTTFKDNIKSWTENASPKDWLALESQDPMGRLTKNEFLALTQNF